jgi:hypothetical protein
MNLERVEYLQGDDTGLYRTDWTVQYIQYYDMIDSRTVNMIRCLGDLLLNASDVLVQYVLYSTVQYCNE